MTIIKLENGNVELQYTDGRKAESLPAGARLQKDSSRQKIKIIYGQNNIVSINLSEVEFTQIAPAAAVAFTGTLQDLFDLLKEDFFFEDVNTLTSYYQLKTDKYTNLYLNSAVVGATTIFADFITGGTTILHQDIQIKEVNIRVTAGAVGNCVVGFYWFNESTNQFELLFQSTPFDTSIVALSIYSFSPVTLKKGIICPVLHSSVNYTGSTVPAAASINIFGDNGINSAVSANVGIRLATVYTGTLPATLAATQVGTNTNIPNVVVKIA